MTPSLGGWESSHGKGRQHMFPSMHLEKVWPQQVLVLSHWEPQLCSHCEYTGTCDQQGNLMSDLGWWHTNLFRGNHNFFTKSLGSQKSWGAQWIFLLLKNQPSFLPSKVWEHHWKLEAKDGCREPWQLTVCLAVGVCQGLQLLGLRAASAVLFALSPSPLGSSSLESLLATDMGINQKTTAFHSLPSPARAHSWAPSAWLSLTPRWALTLQCGGSRNVLSALRKAVEVDFKDKDKHQSQGIYLFTGGIPDQDMVGRPWPEHPLSPATLHLPLGGHLAIGFSSMIFQTRLCCTEESPGISKGRSCFPRAGLGPESLHF